MTTPGNNVPRRLAAKALLALRIAAPCIVAMPFLGPGGPDDVGTYYTLDERHQDHNWAA